MQHTSSPAPHIVIIISPKQRQARRMAHSREVAARNAAAQETAARTQDMYREALAQRLKAAKQRTVGNRDGFDAPTRMRFAFLLD